MSTAQQSPTVERAHPASSRAMALLAAGVPLTLLIDLAYPLTFGATADGSEEALAVR